MREPMEMEKRIQLVETGGLREIRKTGGGTCKVEDKDSYTKSRYNDLPVVRRGAQLILTHIFVFHEPFCDGSTSISSVQNLAAVSGTMFWKNKSWSSVWLQHSNGTIQCGALDPRQVRFEILYSSQRNA